MEANIQEKIIKAIMRVPGLVGLSNLDISKSGNKLKEEKYNKGITCVETSKGIIVKVFVVISKNARVKTVSHEISKSIESVFRKTGNKIEQILIYVRGVE